MTATMSRLPQLGQGEWSAIGSGFGSVMRAGCHGLAERACYPPDMTNNDRDRWNAKHADAREEQAPNPRLMAALDGDLLRRGQALDLACGRGRHALALARAGFEVLAVDLSDVGLARLAEAASHENLPIRTLQRDLESDGLPPGEFDLVVVHDYLARDLFPAVAEAVAAGGALFYETFTWRHAEATGFRRAFCLEEGELLAAFEGFEILSHEEGELEGRFRESLLTRRPDEPA